MCGVFPVHIRTLPLRGRKSHLPVPLDLNVQLETKQELGKLVLSTKKTQTYLLYIFRRIIFLNFETHLPPDAYSSSSNGKKIVYTHVRSSFFQNQNVVHYFLLIISGRWTRNPTPRPPQAARNPRLPLPQCPLASTLASWSAHCIAVIDGRSRPWENRWVLFKRPPRHREKRVAAGALNSRACVLCRYLGQLSPAS